MAELSNRVLIGDIPVRKKLGFGTKLQELPYRVVIDEILVHIVLNVVVVGRRRGILQRYIPSYGHDSISLYTTTNSQVRHITAIVEIDKPDKFLHWGYFKSDPYRRIFCVFKSVHGTNVAQFYALDKMHYLACEDDRFIGPILSEKSWSNIKCLDIDDHSPTEDFKLDVLFSENRFPSLEYLHLSDETTSNRVKNILFEKLRTLVIHDSDLVEFFARNKAPSLKRLFLTNSYNHVMFEEHASQFYRFPVANLIKVSMWQVKHFNWEVFSSPEARNLRFVELWKVDCKCRLYSVQDEIYLDDMFKCKRCRSLRINPPTVVEWVCMPRLTLLRVVGCKMVSDSSFARQTFAELRECYIEKCNVSKKFVESHKFPKIEVMEIK